MGVGFWVVCGQVGKPESEGLRNLALQACRVWRWRVWDLLNVDHWGVGQGANAGVRQVLGLRAT